MSSCLNPGGGRTYGFNLDLVKSPSPLIACSSQSSSPSSTLSESSNSPLTISTRKPRTPRKRPNQTYTEAAALLSTIYPNIFSTKNLAKLCKHTRSYDSFTESSELLPPLPSLDNAGFLLSRSVPEKPTSRIEPNPKSSSNKPHPGVTGTDCLPSSPNGQHDGYEEDFGAESILDEEIEEGIDSIIGNLSVNNDSHGNSYDFGGGSQSQTNAHYWNLMGLAFGGNFEFAFGFGRNVRALKQVEDGDWWRNSTVEVSDISPKFKVTEKKKKSKKKKKKMMAEEDDLQDLGPSEENLQPGLCLKLNYEAVLNAWSDRGSPFSDKNSKAEAHKSSVDSIVRF
ncbi:protein CHLOROPLAST IMPORT APPARATUS 2-like [Magnolia sinica]|uniref:protein CHLOROPLAST IMPORT APPARATUS 2-like n=1 Tax=Magnolia sinica TaxID=86752 RepID=UPI0026580D66|nr:protein CHLOROPLAST IMPORT APPARATUS 2-like [Magnolia sinica]